MKQYVSAPESTLRDHVYDILITKSFVSNESIGFLPINNEETEAQGKLIKWISAIELELKWVEPRGSLLFLLECPGLQVGASFLPLPSPCLEPAVCMLFPT